MVQRDIIVVGASAGGLEVLVQMVRELPPGLPAALFVVCHFPTEGRSVLPEILSRQGQLLARHAQDGEPIYPGQIYVAPPGFHLTLQPGTVRLLAGPRENHHRPAIDPLFRSAARTYGRRVIGVVLSGASHDGVAGLLAIRSAGGIAVVQDPDTALVATLPRSALDIVGADHVRPPAELGRLLADLVRQPVPGTGDPLMTDPLEQMPDIVESDLQAQMAGQRGGQLTTLTCPECGGTLWQVDGQGLLRFRCHLGHAFYGEGLFHEQALALEAALWTAVRSFREKAALGWQLAEEARSRGQMGSAERFTDQARLAEQYGKLIHQYLLQSTEPAPVDGSRDPGTSPAPD